jgi:hypothetical protein
VSVVEFGLGLASLGDCFARKEPGNSSPSGTGEVPIEREKGGHQIPVVVLLRVVSRRPARQLVTTAVTPDEFRVARLILLRETHEPWPGRNHNNDNSDSANSNSNPRGTRRCTSYFAGGVLGRDPSHGPGAAGFGPDAGPRHQRSPAPRRRRALVTAWPDGLHVREKDGWLPLQFAAVREVHDAAQVVQRVTDGWAPGIEVSDGAGWLPVHFAAHRGRLEVVQILL